MALTATLDRNPAVYAPGDTVILTIAAAAGDRDTVVEQIINFTASAETLGDVTGSFKTNKAGTPRPVTVTDDAGSTYTMVSDDGTTAVFTTTAPAAA